MRAEAPFQADDLAALEERLLGRAAAVVAMEDVFDGGSHWPTVIGMRHDCDNVIRPAVRLAEWEADHGMRSTYYVLHTAPYWQDKLLLQHALERIAGLGHEIGIHNDAVTVHLEAGRDPADVLHEAVDELRGYGHLIRSTVAHGNPRCAVDGYVNDEMFTDCVRPDYGNVKLQPRPLVEFGLDFDANWLPRGDYLSDSGGRWSQPFDEVADVFPARGQLHVLIHPDWWEEAFDVMDVAA